MKEVENDHIEFDQVEFNHIGVVKVKEVCEK